MRKYLKAFVKVSLAASLALTLVECYQTLQIDAELLNFARRPHDFTLAVEILTSNLSTFDRILITILIATSTWLAFDFGIRAVKSATDLLASLSTERFSGFLDLIGLIFPRPLRKTVYFPAKEDLRTDFAEGNRRFRKGWKRYVFLTIIAWSTFLLIVGTAWEGLKRPFGKAVPEVVKGIWRMFT